MPDDFGHDIEPALDAIRAIGGMLGLRAFKVTVRRRTWTGERPGIGTPTVQDVVLTNLGADLNPYRVRVRQVSRKDIISSGGLYADRDLKVGPVTPLFAASAFGPAGGFDDASMDPIQTNKSVEMIWIVSTTDGTYGIPDGGAVFEKIGEEATRLHYYVFLRQTGRVTA